MNKIHKKRSFQLERLESRALCAADGMPWMLSQGMQQGVDQWVAQPLEQRAIEPYRSESPWVFDRGDFPISTVPSFQSSLLGTPSWDTMPTVYPPANYQTLGNNTFGPIRFEIIVITINRTSLDFDPIPSITVMKSLFVFGGNPGIGSLGSAQSIVANATTKDSMQSGNSNALIHSIEPPSEILASIPSPKSMNLRRLENNSIASGGFGTLPIKPEESYNARFDLAFAAKDVASNGSKMSPANRDGTPFVDKPRSDLGPLSEKNTEWDRFDQTMAVWNAPKAGGSSSSAARSALRPNWKGSDSADSDYLQRIILIPNIEAHAPQSVEFTSGCDVRIVSSFGWISSNLPDRLDDMPLPSVELNGEKSQIVDRTSPWAVQVVNGWLEPTSRGDESNEGSTIIHSWLSAATTTALAATWVAIQLRRKNAESARSWMMSTKPPRQTQKAFSEQNPES